MQKPILDACCGSRMFWFNKANEDVVYIDNRELQTTLCDGRQLVVSPDLVSDFTNMPFVSKSFSLVVFDPPHLYKAGEKSWLAQKHGVLPQNWQEVIKAGFNECFRVLKDNGVLIFKWNEEQIPTSTVLKLSPYEPLFGDKRGKTRWIVFMKGVPKKGYENAN